MTNAQYALNWNDHTTHIKKAFDTLLQNDEFVDVTISCTAGKRIKAHRMVLSACSTYFHDLLRDNPCQHPIIIMRDIEFENIESIIRFMYNGEVQIPTEKFSSFLKAAELLEVSGLTTNSEPADVNKPSGVANSEKSGEDVPVVRPKPGPASRKLERKQVPVDKKRPSLDDSPQQQRKKKERVEVKEELPKAADNTINIDEEDVEEGLSQMEEASLIEPMTEQKILRMQELLSDESYLTKEANPESECPVCAQKYPSLYYLRLHVPFHLGETKCPMCGKVFSRKDLLKRHVMKVHNVNPNVFSFK